MLSRAFKGLLAVGSLISSAGAGIFTSRNAVNYVSKDSILEAPIAAFAALSGYAVQLNTRVPSMLKETKKSDEDIDIDNLSLKAKAAYYTLLSISITSGGFSSLFAYLSAISLAEFIASLVEANIEDTPIIVTGGAIFIAFANMASYYSFNYEASKLNGKKMADFIEHSDEFVLDKTAALKTLGISFFNVASTPFLGYFGTKSALGKLTFIPLPPLAKQIISGISAFTYLTATLTTYVPSMYSYFNAEPTKNIKEPDFTCRVSLKSITYGFGFFDSIRVGAGNGMGMINTSADILKISHYDPALMTCATLTMTSTAFLNMTFSIRDGYKKTAALIVDIHSEAEEEIGTDDVRLITDQDTTTDFNIDDPDVILPYKSSVAR